VTQIQIIGIRKPAESPNHHSAITHYQWKDSTGKIDISTRAQMVDWILEDETNRKAYVQDKFGHIAYCRIVRNVYGTSYLETYPDATTLDNLLSLPRI
jgi:hypothetical protein